MSRVTFRVAEKVNDAGIRALLRESAMKGEVRLSLRCEPSYFAAAAIEGEHHAIVAVEEGCIVCVGGVSVRERYLNGVRARVGYLGRLRLAASHAGRFDVVRRGYQFFDDLRPTLDAAAYFTSVASDNTRARRLLERGVRGLPAYTFIGELATVLLRTGRWTATPGREPKAMRDRLNDEGVHAVRGSPEAAADSIRGLVALHQRHAPAYQLAPVWTAEDFAAGPRGEDVRLLVAGDEAVGGAAVWDQRAFKQIVVDGYSRRLRLLRPALNALAYAGRGVPLPPAGSTLAQAFASHLVLPPVDRPEWLTVLLRSLLFPAAARGATALAVGLDARDPRLPLVRRCFGPFVYRTRLYAVHSPGGASPLVPDARLLAPEIALL